jgi:SAM-dependent methyltransferase
LKFKDFFSDRADLYATYRPHYPDAFFLRISQLTNDHRVAVDCGTGNGQAAIGLAKYFDRVFALDPSEEQLGRAIADQRVEYRSARAEATGLDDSSVNLVTAAQALHWFDATAFFLEAKRILAPGGCVAVWGYADPILDSIPLHKTLHDFNRGLLEEYWYPERQLLLDGYRTLDFPFREVTFPRFVLEMRWTLAQVVGYLRSWSATSRYAEERGVDPVVELEAALARSWGDPDKQRIVRWPLFVRAGMVNK